MNKDVTDIPYVPYPDINKVKKDTVNIDLIVLKVSECVILIALVPY